MTMKYKLHFLMQRAKVRELERDAYNQSVLNLRQGQGNAFV